MDDLAISKSVTYSLPRYLVAALKERADDEHRTPSNMLRVILEERLVAPRGDQTSERG